MFAVYRPSFQWLIFSQFLLFKYCSLSPRLCSSSFIDSWIRYASHSRLCCFIKHSTKAKFVFFTQKTSEKWHWLSLSVVLGRRNTWNLHSEAILVNKPCENEAPFQLAPFCSPSHWILKLCVGKRDKNCQSIVFVGGLPPHTWPV